MLFDLLMKGPDSYWKRRWHAEEIRRRSAEADARCVRGMMEEQEDNLDLLMKRDVGQAHAIELLNKQVEELRTSLAERTRYADGLEREIDALRTALKAQENAREIYQMNEKLWETIHRKTVGGGTPHPSAALTPSPQGEGREAVWHGGESAAPQ